MKINIKKYIDKCKNCVAINFISTYPSSWVDFLESNKSFLEKHKAEDAVDFNNNKYYEEYLKIKDAFEEIISTDDISFLCFHTGRYTVEEIEDIRKNGLFAPTVDKIDRKFENLYKNNYISKSILSALKENNYLKIDSSRADLLYLKIGYPEINTNEYNCTIYTFLTTYGGEIFYHTLGKIFDKKSIMDKLNKLSFPCISIINVPSKNISRNDISNIAESVLYNFLDDPMHNIETTIILNSDMPVLDIIKLDILNEIVCED